MTDTRIIHLLYKEIIQFGNKNAKKSIENSEKTNITMRCCTHKKHVN